MTRPATSSSILNTASHHLLRFAVEFSFIDHVHFTTALGLVWGLVVSYIEVCDCAVSCSSVPTSRCFSWFLLR